MQLENRFTVPVPVDEAWRVLLDVQRVAPCMPGATLTSVEGDEFKGNVKVKVGPIVLTYQGHARFKDRDDKGHSVVIEASGKETRGPGTAAATVLTRLVDKGGGATEVHVVTDLAVTGKPAQFGRGVMADVSSKLIDRFASCLAAEVRSGSTAEPTTAEAPPAESPTAKAAPAESPTAESPPAEPASHDGHPHQLQHEHPHLEHHPRAAEAIDLLETAGLPIAKRLVPLLAAVAGVVLLIRWRLRR
jgi:carbon monoxide dehydrogenase subunit G